MVQHFKPPFAMLSTHMKMPVAILAALLNLLLANLPEKALNIDTNPWVAITWETQKENLDASFNLIHPWLLWLFGGIIQ